MRRTLLILAMMCSLTLPAWGGGTLQDVARLEGQQEVLLRGFGLVTGLDGSGDSGSDLLLARPLAEAYRRNGLAVPSLEEMQNAQSVALVSMQVIVPPQGARVGDALDVRVSVIHSAESLEGGELYISPVLGPIKDSGLFAFAGGPVQVLDRENPTTGIVYAGAKMVRDIVTTLPVSTHFNVIIKPQHAYLPYVLQVAQELNEEILLSRPNAEPIALALDERTIRVTVPVRERGNAAAFVAQVMKTDVRNASRYLPARIECDTRSEQIVMTGDVRISPAALSAGDLLVNVTLPPIEPTPQAPRLETNRFVGVETGAGEQELARLQDLLDAMNAIRIPTGEQIRLLKRLHEAGSLHAKLVIDGAEQ